MIYLDLGGAGPGLTTNPPFISTMDRSFLYGDGLFETVLAKDGHLPLWALHLERLERSAAALGIGVPGGLTEAAYALAEDAGPGEHALRLTLTRGAAPGRGYEPPAAPRPTVLITTSPYRRPAGSFTAVLAASRLWPGSPQVQHKSTSALEWVVARQAARERGAQEAIFLNANGSVAQGAATNLFLVQGGNWVTPPLSEGALPGIMRRQVLRYTGAVERPVTPDELYTADAVVLTNALMGCIFLSAVEGRPLRQEATLPSLEGLLAL